MRLEDFNPKIQEQIRQQLAGVVGGLPAPKRQHHDVSQPSPCDADEKRGPCRLVINLVVFRRRPLDSDNLVFGCKWLRDSIAKSLGVDDGHENISWICDQLKTTGREGVIVKIEVIET